MHLHVLGSAAIGYRCAWEGVAEWTMTKRRCPACSSQVEDEVHAVFHCPTYMHPRLQYGDLFDSAHSLRSFLASNPAHRVAAFFLWIAKMLQSLARVM